MKTIAVVFTALMSPLAVSAQSGTSCPAPQPGVVHVIGEVPNPFTLDASNWETFPQATVTGEGHGTPKGAYSGVPISALLAKAGVPSGPNLRGKAVRQVLSVEAADGYRASYGVAELDTAFVSRAVILAHQFEGKPLDPQNGPYQVIVEGEKRHARWVRSVTCLRVLTPQ